MKIEIKLGEEIQAFNGQPEKVKQSFLSLSKEQLTSDIEKETPVSRNGGKLRGSWTPHLSPDKLVVENTRNYALFVEKGTGIFSSEGRHRIFPRNANVMHATINGEEVFFTNSRGQPGQHMAEKGFMNYRKKIPNIFRQAVIKNTGGKK